ncbi:MAG: sulfatase-like hydrolase/transferase, partial [Oscillospiraceae bacterium]|nr:sulfatase-like hydrolase/transferase [Oscillospiraceae bacterium]
DWSESTKQYMATVMEVDRALEALLKGLEEAGQLDKTLIVAVADHIPYTAVEAVGELRGTNYGTSDDARNCNERYLDTEVYRNTLIMWSSSMEERVVVDKVCTQVDILPTVSNLLGLEYDSRMLAGSDMLSSGDGLVVFYSKSWRTNNGYYDSFTQEFTLNEGLKLSESVVQAYVDVMNKIVDCKRNLTTMILATDFYDLALSGQ